MTREEAVRLVDDHKNKLVNPVEMLHWTWLRVIINNLPDEQWDAALSRAHGVLSQ